MNDVNLDKCFVNLLSIFFFLGTFDLVFGEGIGVIVFNVNRKKDDSKR